MAGTGKSKKAHQITKNIKKKLFLSITAAIVHQAPKSFDKKMTIAAFLTQKVKTSQDTVIYIDEISMVTAKQLDAVLKLCPRNNCIMTGDQFQIQPIPPQNHKETDPLWWFEAKEYKKRTVTTETLTTQHRLDGNECKDIRAILNAVAQTDERTWKHLLINYIAERRQKKAPENAHIIVFTNKDLAEQTKTWANANNLTLDKNGLTENMPVTITKNKIQNQIYAHRNGQEGTLIKIAQNHTIVKDKETNKLIKVANRGHAATIPNVKSAIAQTADSAQGKTITNPCHIIINTHYPDPPHLIVAATRSKFNTFYVKNMQQLENAIINATFHPSTLSFTKQLRT